METRKRFSAKRTTTIVMAAVALLLFTGLTFGISRNSNEDIVKAAAKTSTFSDDTAFVIMRAELLRSSTPATYSETIDGNDSQRYVCSIDRKQYQKLSILPDVKSESFEFDSRRISFVALGEQTTADAVRPILGNPENSSELICRQVKENGVFLVPSAPSVSLVNDRTRDAA